VVAVAAGGANGAGPTAVYDSGGSPGRLVACKVGIYSAVPCSSPGAMALGWLGNKGVAAGRARAPPPAET